MPLVRVGAVLSTVTGSEGPAPVSRLPRVSSDFPPSTEMLKVPLASVHPETGNGVYR